jgi:hypothetical protein
LVTLVYIMIFILLSVLFSLFDMKLFNYSYFHAMWNLFYTEMSSGIHFLLLFSFIGLVLCVFIDIRIYLNKKKSKKTKGGQTS